MKSYNHWQNAIFHAKYAPLITHHNKATGRRGLKKCDFPGSKKCDFQCKIRPTYPPTHHNKATGRRGFKN